MKAKLFLLFALAAQLCFGAETRFVAMDVFIDTKGEPLAAYQLEIAAPSGVKIVGIEGGEHEEFRKAPFYDPKAIQSQKVIVAAFSTAADTKLPKAATRVLTLHIESQAADPKFETTLILTAKSNGEKTRAEITLSERK